MLDHKLIEDFCTIVARGNFRLTAAQRLGIPYNMLNAWFQRGRREIKKWGEDGPPSEPSIFAHFVLAVEMNEAEMQRCLVQDVVETGDIKAKQWFLTHRWNKLFNRNPNTRIDDDTMEEVKIDPAVVLAERLRDLGEKLNE